MNNLIIDKHNLLILDKDMTLTNKGVIDNKNQVRYDFNSYAKDYSFHTTGGLWQTLSNLKDSCEIRVLVDYKNALELYKGFYKTAVYNYGQPFSLNLIDKNKTPGCIEYYNENKWNILYPKIQCSWNPQDNGLIQFRIEELVTNENNLTKIKTRFIHSERNPVTKTFTHLDGSCKIYDFDSGDRHIEVKAKKKGVMGHHTLTSNESEILIKDPKYWLYLVEGDFENNPDNIKLYMIPQQDLLCMAQLKIHARLTRLSNKVKRQKWLFREKIDAEEKF